MDHGMQRQRRRIETIDRECADCGHQGLELMESSRIRDDRGWRRRFQGRHIHRYLRCPSCHARASASGSYFGTAIGWFAVVVLVFVTLGLTAALAGMLLLVSLPLALGAVAVVLVATALIIWNARRQIA